jgi:hypothetical protein
MSIARAEARGPQRRKARRILKKRVEAAWDARDRDLARQWQDFRAAEKGWSGLGRA